MAKLIFLGTSNAISDESHENTHMLVVGEDRIVLIDCPSNPVQRFKKVGIDFNRLSDLILTHFHPDHVSGVPLLLLNMWLMGRLQPIDIHGLRHTIDRMEKLMGFYGWSGWPDFFPVKFHRLPERPLGPVLEGDEFSIFASPVQHFIPTIGLRVEFSRPKKILAYSSDTKPCAQVVQLAKGADVLIHEASGASSGHSSAIQAGEEACLAEVGSLILVHYPTGQPASNDLVVEAGKKFKGPVMLAEDYMVLNFGEET
jgi:ribonuclease Z